MAECRTGTSHGTASRSTRFLMIVDSDPNELFYTSMLLQRFEYHICTAKTAEEAIEMASVAVPALLIAAENLPDPGIRDLIRKLRRDPRTESVPVLGLVPAGDLVASKRCIEAGSSDCIMKPVQAEELYRAVQAAIEPHARKNIRIQTKLPVTVNNVPLDCSGGECATVLSEHGMYIRTLKPMPAAMRVPVVMVINGRTISLDAVVLYSHGAGQGPFGEPGMGIKFTRIDRADQEFIRAYIREHVTRGLARDR